MNKSPEEMAQEIRLAAVVKMIEPGMISHGKGPADYAFFANGNSSDI